MVGSFATGALLATAGNGPSTGRHRRAIVLRTVTGEGIPVFEAVSSHLSRSFYGSLITFLVDPYSQAHRI